MRQNRRNWVHGYWKHAGSSGLLNRRIPLEDKVWRDTSQRHEVVSVAGEKSVKLKKLVADLGLDMLMLQDILTKKTLRSVEKREVVQYL